MAGFPRKESGIEAGRDPDYLFCHPVVMKRCALGCKNPDDLRDR